MRTALRSIFYTTKIDEKIVIYARQQIKIYRRKKFLILFIEMDSCPLNIHQLLVSYDVMVWQPLYLHAIVPATVLH